MASSLTTRFDKMFLIGIWVESVLYGMNFIIFLAAMYVLILKRKAMVPKFLVVLSILLFTLSTAHVALVMRQLLEAFIFAEPGTASVYFAEQHNRLPNTKLVLYSLNVCAQDLVLIWRLWVVWDRKWWIAAPFLLLEIIHTSAGFIAEARGSIPGISVFDKTLRDWALVNWTMDLFINITCTGLIAFRLWLVGRRVRAVAVYGGGNKYTGVILTMIESGALFCVATIILVGLYLASNVATFAAVDSVTQLATITPLLIIVRVGLDLMHGKNIHDTVRTPNITELGKPIYTTGNPTTLGGKTRVALTMDQAFECFEASLAVHALDKSEDSHSDVRKSSESIV
ncbi:hypothetical protein CYLTODRAFT_404673 [Cylindrobasidium torrendii FP15055 ss-10]|uniref:Family A G protein-coupled receptor-like protein n=1 Tax=Cylindrobasidium torrendii FP15055 ss-10 TaxID=1314674 RepID=A0A0D7AWX0_9AGAR|nr:hypothetical protein CYLTODRAFT_404673 [Cylindrobasidium torrendii FP15055 ss-10]